MQELRRAAHGILEQHGEVIGYGRGFKVFFEPGVVEFTAVGGAAIELRFESVTRGGALLRDAGEPSSTPRVEGRSALYEHGAGLTERYDVQLDGVEQSFVFDEPLAGDGDLVVRLSLATDLRPDSLGVEQAEVRLVQEGPGVGEILIRKVLGVDASGRSSEGWLRMDEGALELVLPHEFVEAAAYPLVLDPFIASGSIPLSSNPEATAVAFDETNQSYVSVWTEIAPSGFESDIWGALVNAADAQPMVAFPIDITPQHSTDPDVANINDTDRFVVVAGAEDVPMSEVRCTSIDAASGALVGTTTLATHFSFGGSLPPHAAVCGDPLPGFNDAVVAYRFDILPVQVVTVDIPSAGVPSITSGPTSTGKPGRPRLTKGLGEDGYALLALNFASSLGAACQVVRYDGVLLDCEDDFAPSSTWMAVDGDGSTFHLAEVRNGEDVLVVSEWSYDPGTDTLTHQDALDPLVVATGVSSFPYPYPSIGLTSDGLLLSWYDGTFARRATVDNGFVCESIAVSPTGFSTGIATALSGTNPVSGAAVTASRGLISFAYDDQAGSGIVTYLVDAELPSVAAVEQPFNSVVDPNAATLLPGVTTAPLVGETWDPMIQLAPGEVPAAPFLLLVGEGPWEVPSVGVAPNDVFLVNPFGFFTFMSSATLQFSVPIPPNCHLAGLPLTAQGAYARVFPAPAGVSLTSGIDLIIGMD